MENEPKLTKTETLHAVIQALRYCLGSSPRFLGVVALEEIFNRLVPFVNAWILARLISILPHVFHSHSAQTTAFRYIVILALVTVVPSIVTSFSSVYKARQRIELDLKIGRRLQAAFAALPYALYEDKRVLDEYDRASRFARNLGGFVLNRLTDIFGALVTFIIATIAFWHFSPGLAILIFILTLPTVWLELRLQRMREKLWRDNTRNYRKASVYSELLQPRTIKETRLLGLVGMAIDRSQHFQRTAEMSAVQADQRTEKYRLGTLLLNAVIEALVLIRVVQRIASGNLPVGQFIFVQQIANQYLGSLSNMSSLVQDLDELLFGVSEFSAIINYPKEPAGEPVRQPAATVALSGISFRYPQSKAWALRDVTLNIPGGKTIAIVGENGAGKTTLVKLLMKLYDPSEGTVTIGDQSLQAIGSDSWHQNIGVLFQDFQTFYDFTVQENVWFGNIARPRTDSAATKALKAADAWSFVQALPKQADTYLGKYMDEQNGTDLSGGQAQRLAIARTLFRNAPILILDEPTSAIDAKAEYRIFKTIEEARKGLTTILISHRFSTIRKADYIYVLDKGTLHEQGTHDELIKLGGLYHEMFTKQAEGYM